MPRKRITDVIRREVIDQIKAGKHVDEVAASTGVSRRSIYTIKDEARLGHTVKNRASHVVHLRLSPAEMEALKTLVQDRGYANQSAALRSFIRAATGFLEMPKAETDALFSLWREHSAQGRNLNQIALKLNKAKFLGVETFSDEDHQVIEEVRRQNHKLGVEMRRLVVEIRQWGRNAFHTATGSPSEAP
jgi:Arc/MetJ-type ribon-helix-helix transcriptional regulator